MGRAPRPRGVPCLRLAQAGRGRPARSRASALSYGPVDRFLLGFVTAIGSSNPAEAFEAADRRKTLFFHGGSAASRYLRYGRFPSTCRDSAHCRRQADFPLPIRGPQPAPRFPYRRIQGASGRRHFYDAAARRASGFPPDNERSSEIYALTGLFARADACATIVQAVSRPNGAPLCREKPVTI